MPRLAITGATSVAVRGSIVDAPATSYLRGTVIGDELRSFTTDSTHTYPTIDVSGTLQDRVVRQDDGRLCFYYRIYDLVVNRGTFDGIKHVGVKYDDSGIRLREVEVDFRLDGLGKAFPDFVESDGINITFVFDPSALVTPAALSRFMYILPTAPTVSEYTTGGRVRLYSAEWSVDIPGCFQPALPRGRAATAKTPSISKRGGK